MKTTIDNGLGTNVVLEASGGARWVAPPGRSYSDLAPGVWVHGDSASTNSVELSTNAVAVTLTLGPDRWLVEETAGPAAWAVSGFCLAAGLFFFGYLLSVFSRGAKGWANLD